MKGKEIFEQCDGSSACYGTSGEDGSGCTQCNQRFISARAEKVAFEAPFIAARAAALPEMERAASWMGFRILRVGETTEEGDDQWENGYGPFSPAAPGVLVGVTSTFFRRCL